MRSVFAVILAQALAAGCWTQQETPGGADADADTDTDNDTDTDTDTDSDSDGDLLGPDFVDALDTVGGCGDVYIYACGDYREGEVALFFTAQGYILGMYEDELDSLDQYFAFPSSEAALSVAVGTHLCDAECVDIPAPTPPVVWATFAPTSGSAYLYLEPMSDTWDEWYTPAKARLTLEETTFVPVEDDGGDPVHVEDLVLDGIDVGWLPGK